MKIIAISDIHGYLPKIEDSADIMLIAGDVMPLNIQRNMVESKLWLEGAFAEWVDSIRVDRVFLVGGNHDFYLENILPSQVMSLEQSAKKLCYVNGLVMYMDSLCKVWSIYGSPYCHIYGSWAFMHEDYWLEQKYLDIPDEVDIIISHDPPFALGDADIILDDGRAALGHIGNKPLSERLSRVNYKLLVCGHIHSGDHVFNETHRVVNVSYLNEHYRPHYKPFTIEL